MKFYPKTAAIPVVRFQYPIPTDILDSELIDVFKSNLLSWKVVTSTTGSTLTLKLLTFNEKTQEHESEDWEVWDNQVVGLNSEGETFVMNAEEFGNTHDPAEQGWW